MQINRVENCFQFVLFKLLFADQLIGLFGCFYWLFSFKDGKRNVAELRNK